MPRWVLIALVSLVIVTTSGVGAIATAAFGCCEECETETGAADAGTTEDSDHGNGCAPFCSDCACPSSVSPALAESPPESVATLAPVALYHVEEAPAGSPTLPGVFHPPRRSC